MYRHKPANTDRSKKRSDTFIHKNMIKALYDVADSFGERKHGAKYINILPNKPNDPKFADADPNNFLVVYAIKQLGLTWFEIEHWMDEISNTDPYRFHFEMGSICDVDERKRYYKKDLGMGRNYIINLIRFISDA
jgi:hypothetical protein